jgi:hypothetical protein
MDSLVIGHWIIVVMAVGVYFVPCIVGQVRDVKPYGWIALLNVFLGWTFLGWVVALVWAAVAEKKTAELRIR